MKKLALCLLTLFASMSLMADVLPPGAASLMERYQSNPNTFDRYDDYCKDQRPGDRCSIPGNAFEGGGAGVCERAVHRQDLKIDLLCTRHPMPQIERGWPAEGKWQASESLCEQARGSAELRNMLAREGWVCEPLVRISDRFCQGLQAGAACSAEVSLGLEKSSFKGVCTTGVVSQSAYFRGRREVTRPVLSCEPEHPTPAASLNLVSSWKKLLQ